MKLKPWTQRTGRLCFWGIREKRSWTEKFYKKHIDMILYIKEIEIVECASMHIWVYQF